ncbi:MAG: hypothetical protein AAB660_01505 [Patescibacteria group bacterium]
MDISNFLNKVNVAIINPLIILVFAIAVLVFFFGIFQFISKAGESTEREKGKQKIIYGLIGMFIMFSAYGLIRIVLGTFGVSQPTYLGQ